MTDLDFIIDNTFFTLDENKNVIPSNVLEWGEMFEKMDRIVAKTDSNGMRVSTMFLGLNHGWGDEILVFETMIFSNVGNKYEDHYCDRYSTWDEAVKGHEKAVRKTYNPVFWSKVVGKNLLKIGSK